VLLRADIRALTAIAAVAAIEIAGREARHEREHAGWDKQETGDGFHDRIV
jgi:hypothetical protein